MARVPITVESRLPGRDPARQDSFQISGCSNWSLARREHAVKNMGHTKVPRELGRAEQLELSPLQGFFSFQTLPTACAAPRRNGIADPLFRRPSSSDRSGSGAGVLNRSLAHGCVGQVIRFRVILAGDVGDGEPQGASQLAASPMQGVEA